MRVSDIRQDNGPRRIGGMLDYSDADFIGTSLDTERDHFCLGVFLGPSSWKPLKW